MTGRAALALVVCLFVVSQASAQAGSGWPHDAPFPTLESSEAVNTSIRRLDASVDACRSFYATRLESGAELASGVTVVGMAWDVQRGVWQVTLGRVPNELLRLTLVEVDGRCEEQLARGSWAVRDGDWRPALPPLPVAGGGVYDPDERNVAGR